MNGLNGQPESAPINPGTDPQQTQATPPQAAPPVSPQDAARQDVYAQYASLYNPQVPSDPPPSQAPEAPQQPSVSASQPQEDPRIAELLSAVEELRQRNAQLESKVNPPPPAPPVEEVHPLQKWVQLMSENKLDEAEKFFIEAYGPKIAAKVQPQLIQSSVEANRAEVEIEKFVTNFEAANQDLLPLRDYVVLGAERRLQMAQNEGKIKTPADFVNEYRKAVTDEANALREKFQLARSAGKEEALTTQRTVLSATTLPPSAMNQNPQPGNTPPQTATSPSDYITMRKNFLTSKMGL